MGLNLMYLFASINNYMLAVTERPIQVHDLYRQINDIILNVKNGYSIILFSFSCQNFFICHYETQGNKAIVKLS